MRICVVWQPGRPRAPCNLQGLGGCCLHITIAGCSTKVCAQQARVVVSKVDEPEEEEEKRSEERIRFLGHPRPTARLHQQVLVVQWNKRMLCCRAKDFTTKANISHTAHVSFNSFRTSLSALLYSFRTVLFFCTATSSGPPNLPPHTYCKVLRALITA